MVNDTELEALIEAGDVKEHPDGSMRWTKGNSQNEHPGTWVQRPQQAAELITSQNAAQMVRLREARRQQEFELAVIRATERYSGAEIANLEEAQAVIIEVQTEKALAQANTAAAKLVLQATKGLDSPAFVQDNRKVEMNFMTFTFKTKAELETYIRDQMIHGSASVVQAAQYILDTTDEPPYIVDVPIDVPSLKI